MFTVTALLFAALCAAPAHAAALIQPDAVAPVADRSQSATGIIIAAGVSGRVAIYSNDHSLVVELDKPAGRELRLALEPGGYEARLGPDGVRVARFLLRDGDRLLIDTPMFEAPPSSPPPSVEAPAPAPHPHRAGPVDPRHRIEMRLGGWGDGWYDEHGHSSYSGSTQGAFGLEYLNFVRNDLGIGFGLTSLVRGSGTIDGWGDTGTAHVTSGIPIMVRWYPARRLTRQRSVEPYLTTGIGPVFVVDAVHSEGEPYHRSHDEWGSAHVGTTVGGRLGAGVDFRLGHVFTMGVSGAWNWDAGLSNDVWSGSRPGGGEFSVVLGWQFGR